MHRELKPETYGFTEADLDRPIFIDRVLGLETATMRQILRILRRTYCRHIGVQFMHITSPAQKAWIQDRIEGEEKDIRFTPEGRRAILSKLIETEAFEKFCEVKYTGTKRFGIDGAEAMVPALEQIIKRGGQLGVKEIIIGMAHRGRLNVLANVMAKPYRAIFNEFKGGSWKPDDVEGSGDVKYHLGASSDRAFDGNNVHLSLTANPSHLEIVDPVVLGKVRAKQDQRGCAPGERTPVLPLLIHGDAAFAGQGVVAECFGLSGLKGHRTGGSIHFIINNQIGFTTNPRYSRSSPYCSDVARMIEAPIFHVNGDDPEAVVHVAKIATEFRQKFQKPVVIDMFCYRRYGHNEADEPMFTQPLMYKAIKSHPTVIDDLFQAPGRGRRGARPEDAERIKAGFRGAARRGVRLGRRLQAQQGRLARRPLVGHGVCRRRRAPRRHRRRPRAAEDHRPAHHQRPARLPRAQGGAPPARAPPRDGRHGRGHRLVDGRAPGVRLAAVGRVPGAPVGPGLRARHLLAAPRGADRPGDRAPLDAPEARRQRPGELRGHQLDAVGGGRARLRVRLLAGRAQGARSCGRRSSAISPTARRSSSTSSSPRASASGCRMSGLVCLLPHGYEGQGPEHSSARLERYLQLCAEDNWQVANCSTPANYFHILRRQLHRKFRKPLILMTPKSLLRHKRVHLATSRRWGPTPRFHRLLWDDAEHRPGQKIKLKPDDKIKRVVLCSGKVYYDLYEAREEAGIDDVYILRVEQLYPFPARALMHELGALQAGGDRVVPGGAQEHGRLELHRAQSANGCWSASRPSTGAPSMPGARRRRRRRRGSCRSICTSRRRWWPRRSRAGRVLERLAVLARAIGRFRDRVYGLLRRGEDEMTTEIRVPALGESVTEAIVGKWFKSAGDAVAVDEPLVELETDKVTVEVPAPVAGVLGEIKAAEGTTVAVGAVLGAISNGAGGAAAAKPAAAAARCAPSRAPAASQAAGAAPPKLQTSEMPPSPAARKKLAEAGLDADDGRRLGQARPGPQGGCRGGPREGRRAEEAAHRRRLPARRRSRLGRPRRRCRCRRRTCGCRRRPTTRRARSACA